MAGGGAAGSSSGTPDQHDNDQKILPNVSDPRSVQGLDLKILTLKNTPLQELNRGRIGGHVYYKLKLTNPNPFRLNISQISLTNPSSYLFYANNESDNCFNQSWYQPNQLNFPPTASCSFYTTSPWIESYSTDITVARSGSDSFDYTAASDGFGFRVVGKNRIDIWCKFGCTSDSKQNLPDLEPSHHSIAYEYQRRQLSKIAPHDWPLTSFLLSGNRILFPLINAQQLLTMQIYNVEGFKDDLQLRWIRTIAVFPEPVANISPVIFNKNGELAFLAASVNGKNLHIVTHPDASTNPANSSTTRLGTSEQAIVGLDNRLYLYHPSMHLLRYLDSDLHSNNLDKLSSNLPFVGYSFYAADRDSNLILQGKNDIQPACYNQRNNYLPISALIDVSDLNQQKLISARHLYSKHILLPEKFYNLQQQEVPSPFIYQFEPNQCQTLPLGIIEPKYPTVITEKYTVVQTPAGYYFASTEDTSDGENDAAY